MSARKTDHAFVSFDQTPIRYWRYRPERARAAFVLYHGLGEYAERYDPFALYLAERGFRVYAPDLRGFGSSGGPRAHVSDLGAYDRDAEGLLGIVRNDGGLPIFLFGHSFGGLLAARFAARFGNEAPLRGLLLSSPCFGLAFPVPAWLDLLGRILAVLHPRFLHRTPVLPETLTHDPELIQAYLRDGRILHRISSRLYRLMCGEMAAAGETARRIACPVFVAQAGEDQVVRPDRYLWGLFGLARGPSLS
jgi:lysophospholipase